jgi:MOSC domain-containing protein YiiM
VTTAWIFQLARSGGGVPKLAVREAMAGELGLEGDRQQQAKIHGGPDRALCLFSLELIEMLQAEGHPIYPGSTGENITIAGLAWSSLAAGTRVALGPDVIVELTSEADPCKQIAESFVDRKFTRLGTPGEMRWYARVVRGGMLRVAQPACIAD